MFKVRQHNSEHEVHVRKEGEKKWQEFEESDEFEMVSQSSFKAMDWFHCLKLNRQRIPENDSSWQETF